MIREFESVRDYARFCTAREYWHEDVGDGGFEYEKRWLERAGDLMIAPVHRTADFSLRNLTNPLMITTLTVAMAALATLVYYPDQTIETVLKVLPEHRLLTLSGMKFSAYLGVQWLILGLGARTMGRLINGSLMQAWTERRIVPISVGTVIQANNANAAN